MKFFAPKNDWSMASGSSWWPLAGSVATPAGINVSEEVALTFSAVFAALRVLSEAMLCMPIQTKLQKDSRTADNATDHPLWSILHDVPNPEMDIATFMDMQTVMQAGWGNAYAEVQRDSVRNIKALWPIHPSRIPLSNIRRNSRNPSNWSRIHVGQPGELVYWVENDSGDPTPIPASDMLHIPGVMSSNGLTGRSLILQGRNAIGTAIATEQHTSAFFRNGAVSNVAIKSIKPVGKETADRLREQWQKTFGGVHNHYKTLLLEDGMEPVPFSIDPAAAQLIAARQFGVTDIARVFRVPPHMLADLTRATYSNIESQSLDFLIYTMTPWVIRWEKALGRQLLTDEGRRQYRFKFNMNAMLRGDSASRAALYEALFKLGAFSPNDIREKEDLNPVPGGDQRFIQANNMFPLDKAAEKADAEIERLKKDAEPDPVPPVESVEAEEVEAIRKLRDDLIAKVELRDTQEVERLAIRQQRLDETENAARDAVRLAIAARVAGLTHTEMRSVREAAGKPETFLIWQGKFYDDFRGKLASALAPFQVAADRLGFTFDAAVLATDYVTDSTAALASLADLPCDKLESHAETAVADWADRPQRLARYIIPERTDTCAV